MFFDFQFRSLCGIARTPYAAGGLEQQVVELPPQNYSVAKILKTARLQGPVSGCQNQPKTGYVRRYLQSISESVRDLARFLLGRPRALLPFCFIFLLLILGFS